MTPPRLHATLSRTGAASRARQEQMGVKLITWDEQHQLYSATNFRVAIVIGRVASVGWHLQVTRDGHDRKNVHIRVHIRSVHIRTLRIESGLEIVRGCVF